jgi:hypothetical protein
MSVLLAYTLELQNTTHNTVYMDLENELTSVSSSGCVGNLPQSLLAPTASLHETMASFGWT